MFNWTRVSSCPGFCFSCHVFQSHKFFLASLLGVLFSANSQFLTKLTIKNVPFLTVNFQKLFQLQKVSAKINQPFFSPKTFSINFPDAAITFKSFKPSVTSYSNSKIEFKVRKVSQGTFINNNVCMQICFFIKRSIYYQSTTVCPCLLVFYVLYCLPLSLGFLRSLLFALVSWIFALRSFLLAHGYFSLCCYMFAIASLLLDIYDLSCSLLSRGFLLFDYFCQVVDILFFFDISSSLEAVYFPLFVISPLLFLVWSFFVAVTCSLLLLCSWVAIASLLLDIYDLSCPLLSLAFLLFDLFRQLLNISSSLLQVCYCLFALGYFVFALGYL